jgi:protein-S-isoprenylcysteine O-methyltransferase Ste14
MPGVDAGLYVRLYEERELEIRFGQAYLSYRAHAPFFL